MIPGLGIATGGGGFAASSSASSDSGPASIGSFNFTPKSGNVAAIAAALAVVALVLFLKRG